MKLINRALLISTLAFTGLLGIRSLAAEVAGCSGQILCESAPALVEFQDPKKGKLVRVVGIGLRNKGDEDVGRLVANATKACLEAPMPEMKACNKKCPAGCGESTVRRGCKAVIVRGQEDALEKAQGSPEELARNLESKLPGPYKGNEIVAETLATPFPCKVPGARNCDGYQAIAKEKCSVLKEKFQTERLSWLTDIGAAAKKNGEMLDWGENAARCKKGEGKYFTTVTEPICGANDTIATPPRVIVRAECVNSASGFSITSRIHAVKTCEQPRTESKSGAHSR